MPESAATRCAPVTWRIRRFASIDSTNRLLLDEARAGAPAGLVAVADHQTAGRGRLGRTWESTPGAALLVSVLLRPDLPPERLGVLTMAAGLALGDAVEAVADVRAGLKWPNDLVVGERKLAGLLAEAQVHAGRVDAVVLGAGCNVGAAAVPSALAGVATSCDVEAGRPVDRDLLLERYLAGLAARLGDLVSVPDAYRRRSATLGRPVRVEVGTGRTVEGEAVAVSASGALVVRDAEGADVTLHAGDVVHLRPSDGGAAP